MQFDNPENPQIIEDFIRAIGATPVNYALRNECCGNYVALKTPDAVKSQVDKIEHNAALSGAAALVTACPSCKYNLKVNGNGEVDVVYITELLAEALGIKE
jgi:heterodisulfide reductase subunit B